MKSLAFAHYTDISLTLVGLSLFVAVFAGVVVWTSLKENRRRYEDIARFPLNDGEEKQ